MPNPSPIGENEEKIKCYDLTGFGAILLLSCYDPWPKHVSAQFKEFDIRVGLLTVVSAYLGAMRPVFRENWQSCSYKPPAASQNLQGLQKPQETENV